MAEIASLEEEIQHLKNQNLSLAQSLNHWKVQCQFLERDRIEAMKENNVLLAERNNYRECSQKNKQIKMSVEKSAKQLLETLVDASNHIVDIVKLVQDRHQDIIEEKITMSYNKGHSSAPTTPTSNVNHVRPMIRGVMIKNPIIRVSRTLLDPSLRPVTSSRNENPSDQSNPSEHISPSRVKMLDLCVTLRRVDDISQRLQRNVAQMDDDSAASPSAIEESTRNAVFARSIQQSRSPILQDSHDTNFHDNNRFLDDNLSAGDSRSIYTNTLGCVVEESEQETSEFSSNSPQRLNPFIVLRRNLPSSPKSIDHSALIADEDPLEGPSWLLDSVNDEEHKPKTDDFVTIRRKITVPMDGSMSDIELFEESNQVPDSTTSGKDLVAEQLDKSTAPVPQWQSTPKANEVTNNCENTPEVNEIKEEPCNPQVANLSSDCKNQLTAKVSIVKMDDSECLKRSEVGKKRVTRGRKKKEKSVSLPVTIDSAVSKSNTSNKSNDFSISNNSTDTPNASDHSRVSENNINGTSLSQRTRRGEPRDYRERLLNKKLRRN